MLGLAKTKQVKCCVNETLIGRSKAAMSELGWLNGVLYVISRALAKFPGRVRLYKYYLVAQPVSQGTLLPPHRGRHISVRLVVEGDPVVHAFPPPPEIIRRRYAEGAICLAAFEGASLVGYLWLLLGPYEEDEVGCWFIPMPEGKAAWDFDIYVVPRYRFGVGFLRLWDEANRYLKERGVQWTMSRISAFNAASLASHRRLGAIVVSQAVFIVLGSCQLAVTTVFPFVQLSIGARNTPKIRVYPPGDSFSLSSD
jgi:hypothetical protein